MKKYMFLMFAVIALVGMLAISGCKKETYTVTFFPNGGSGVMSPQTFTEGKSQALDINTFTRDGYSFAGWNTTPAGIGVGYTDGQEITVTADMMLYAMWQGNGGSGSGSGSGSGGGQSGPTEGQLNGHDWVNLGLPSGTKWATCNVGSETPEGFGRYYAWGETNPDDEYSWSTYSLCHGNMNSMTKYCNNSEYGYNGFTDNLTTLVAGDDAATANWGTGWRMPTDAEIIELYSNCTQEWTTQNGVEGRKFTGTNGASIFLPAAGYYDNDVSAEINYIGGCGSYWSSSLFTTYTFSARYLNFSSDYCMSSGYARYIGRAVRAVCQ